MIICKLFLCLCMFLIVNQSFGYELDEKFIVKRQIEEGGEGEEEETTTLATARRKLIRKLKILILKNFL
mgnify:CR=1 FL=1